MQFPLPVHRRFIASITPDPPETLRREGREGGRVRRGKEEGKTKGD